MTKIVARDWVESLEAKMLEAEDNVAIPVEHFFGPGIYIRQITIPPETLVVGHHHKGPCMNMLLKGEMKIIDPDGNPRVISAPYIFNSGPGRKVGYALSECVFQNLHATEETDLEKLEDLLIEKSETWQLAHDQIAALAEG